MNNLVILTTLIAVSLFSCSNNSIKLHDQTMNPNDKNTHCQLIEKQFTNKGGKVTEYKELYLRCSVQDYFIKLCEGNVSEDELRPYINLGIEVEMEIRDGMWDHCDENPAYSQSRTGTYVIIKKIVK